MKMKFVRMKKGNKIFASNGVDYNYVFDLQTGFFARWGKTQEDNPEWSPYGPEIADIEITDICGGIRDKNGVRGVCPFCYKSNTINNKGNMSLDTFKKLFNNIKGNLTQIAFGADAQATSNPDLWGMMEYCRENHVVPNITVADIDEATADKIAKYCGACAVSYYPLRNKEICYDCVKMLTDRGMTQVNIHCLVCQEYEPFIYELVEDVKNDSRLAALNAVVMLSLKKKGRGEGFTRMDDKTFKNVVSAMRNAEIGFGFDSCTANKYLATVETEKEKEMADLYGEPCESSLYSAYFNYEGKFYPCSFTEGEKGCNGVDWSIGLDSVNCENFIKDIWLDVKVAKTRSDILKCRACGGNCFHYDV